MKLILTSTLLFFIPFVVIAHDTSDRYLDMGPKYTSLHLEVLKNSIEKKYSSKFEGGISDLEIFSSMDTLVGVIGGDREMRRAYVDIQFLVSSSIVVYCSRLYIDNTEHLIMKSCKSVQENYGNLSFSLFTVQIMYK